MRIVVAIDDSECSKAALEEVAHRDWTAEATFMVLNVISTPSADHLEDFGLTLTKELKVKLKANHDRMINDAVSYLKEHLGPKAPVHMASAEGHAAENIVKVATDWQADLIILGSHGYTGITKFVLGSVAESVLLNAPCSVEIVRMKKTPPETKAVKKNEMAVLY